MADESSQDILVALTVGFNKAFAFATIRSDGCAPTEAMDRDWWVTETQDIAAAVGRDHKMAHPLLLLLSAGSADPMLNDAAVAFLTKLILSLFADGSPGAAYRSNTHRIKGITIAVPHDCDAPLLKAALLQAPVGSDRGGSHSAGGGGRLLTAVSDALVKLGGPLVSFTEASTSSSSIGGGDASAASATVTFPTRVEVCRKEDVLPRAYAIMQKMAATEAGGSRRPTLIDACTEASKEKKKEPQPAAAPFCVALRLNQHYGSAYLLSSPLHTQNHQTKRPLAASIAQRLQGAGRCLRHVEVEWAKDPSVKLAQGKLDEALKELGTALDDAKRAEALQGKLADVTVDHYTAVKEQTWSIWGFHLWTTYDIEEIKVVSFAECREEETKRVVQRVEAARKVVYCAKAEANKAAVEALIRALLATTAAVATGDDCAGFSACRSEVDIVHDRTEGELDANTLRAVAERAGLKKRVAGIHTMHRGWGPVTALLASTVDPALLQSDTDSASDAEEEEAANRRATRHHRCIPCGTDAACGCAADAADGADGGLLPSASSLLRRRKAWVLVFVALVVGMLAQAQLQLVDDRYVDEF